MFSKVRIAIMNVIVTALCVVAIFMYFTKPFMTLTIKFKISTDLVEMIMPSDDETAENNVASLMSAKLYEDSSSSGLNLSKEDIEDIISELPEFEIPIEIPQTLLLDAFTFKGEEADKLKDFITDELIGKNIDGIIETLEEPLGKVVKKLATTAASVVIKDAIAESLENTGNDELKQILSDNPALSEALDNCVESVYEVLDSGEAKVEDLVDAISENYKDFAKALKDSELAEFADIPVEEFSDDEKEEMVEQLNDMLTELDMLDEDGNIKDISSIIGALLNSATSGGETAKENETVVYIGKKLPTAKAFEETTPTEEGDNSLAETVKDLVYDKLNLDDDTITMISTVMKVLAIVLFFEMFTWAWLIIKMLLRVWKKNPSIKVWFPVVFGWLPQLIVWILVFAVNIVIPKVNIESLAEVRNILTSMNFKLVGVTSALIPSMCALALFVVSILYVPFRKSVKRFNRRERRKEKKLIKAEK